MNNICLLGDKAYSFILYQLCSTENLWCAKGKSDNLTASLQESKIISYFNIPTRKIGVLSNLLNIFIFHEITRYVHENYFCLNLSIQLHEEICFPL